ncbi:hypothetical protein FPOA_07322 [Fusarium poae]|uniref:Uncharacterized protein n=1 Tax=Fusarium poae TaxID=36050 RepID=A0A1B8AK67_FUSPO|nr:hypothetical protein FPOA_07322 [Fusarium poae]
METNKQYKSRKSKAPTNGNATVLSEHDYVYMQGGYILVSVGAFVSDSAPYISSASALSDFCFMHGTAAVTSDSCIYALLVAESSWANWCSVACELEVSRVTRASTSAKTVMTVSMYAVKRLPGRPGINPSKEGLIVEAA